MIYFTVTERHLDKFLPYQRYSFRLLEGGHVVSGMLMVEKNFF